MTNDDGWMMKGWGSKTKNISRKQTSTALVHESFGVEIEEKGRVPLQVMWFLKKKLEKVYKVKLNSIIRQQLCPKKNSKSVYNNRFYVQCCSFFALFIVSFFHPVLGTVLIRCNEVFFRGRHFLPVGFQKQWLFFHPKKMMLLLLLLLWTVRILIIFWGDTVFLPLSPSHPL